MQPFVAQGRVFNIFKTLTNHPALMKRWMVFANHVLGKSTLPVRERELLILRIGYLCQAGYEWGQHVEISRQAGMSDEEIRFAKTGPDTYRFDWRDVKRYTDLARKCGVQRFEWCHPFTQWGVKNAIRFSSLPCPS